MFGFNKQKPVVTDEEKIKEVLERGVSEIISKESLEKKLKSGKRLRIKLGIDPTSPNIHLGRTVPLLKLKDFQDLGHQIVLIVGDSTGVVGDTSDKDSERPMLDSKTIEKNKKSYFEQMGKILDLNLAETHYNSSWLNKLGYEEIGEQANVFSINQFIQRENIKKRLDVGKRVSLREVLYPLMQGYDSVSIKADVEVGGTDQKFNLLAGRDLQVLYKQNPQDIVMGPLVEGVDGRKMSSSWGNTININDSAKDMFGKVMSIKDELIINYFKYMTRISMSEINKHDSFIKQGGNPKEVKEKLAFEITSMYHGKEVARDAVNSFNKTFSNKEIPDDVPEIKKEAKESYADVLLRSKIVDSKNDLRRLAGDGAITNLESNSKIDNLNQEAETGVVKVGKRRFIKII